VQVRESPPTRPALAVVVVEGVSDEAAERSLSSTVLQERARPGLHLPGDHLRLDVLRQNETVRIDRSLGGWRQGAHQALPTRPGLAHEGRSLEHRHVLWTAASDIA
jgi:hypothetical protein